jgi:hypothetical protein
LNCTYISRIEERAKETSKTTKFLYKMLSNKIVITPPKDPSTLTGWREKLERDVEQIKSETNQVNLRKALERSSIIKHNIFTHPNKITLINKDIECANLNSPMLKKLVFTPDNVEKIIGWAVSHHLMVEAPSTSSISASPSPVLMTTDTLPPALTPAPATPTPATPPSPSQALITITPPPNTTTSTTAAAITTTTTTTTKPEKIDKLEIGLKSIEYAIEMLTSHDPDTKAVVRAPFSFT